MKLILFLLALTSVLSAQFSVKTIPSSHSATQIYSDTVAATTVTTSAISCRQWEGAATLFLDVDSLTGSSNYGAMIVEYELYDVTQAKWFHHFADADTETDLGTVAATKVGQNVFIVLAQDASATWSWADSVRFKFNQAAADTVIVTASLGGL